MASPSPSSPPVRNKRQKREEYLAASKASGGNGLPQKKFYRQRAHANPFSDHRLTYPANPSLMDWSPYFPAYVAPASPSAVVPRAADETQAIVRPLVKPVTVADVGCGFGGLLVALSPLLPDELILGLEIRNQVHDFTHSRILALRAQHSPPSSSSSSTTNAKYQNISSLRANTMKFLPNLFPRASLTRLFLCFPDPHFKARKHKARIVSPTLVAEYAYVMRPGGRVYVITDVRDLYDWIRACFDGTATQQDVDDDAAQQQQQQRPREVDARSELWEEVPEEERERDVCMRAVREETEEGRKVQRNGGDKFAACWRRRRDPDWPLDILVED